MNKTLDSIHPGVYSKLAKLFTIKLPYYLLHN